VSSIFLAWFSSKTR